jgi:hypothetical protein
MGRHAQLVQTDYMAFARSLARLAKTVYYSVTGALSERSTSYPVKPNDRNFASCNSSGSELFTLGKTISVAAWDFHVRTECAGAHTVLS